MRFNLKMVDSKKPAVMSAFFIDIPHKWWQFYQKLM